MVSPRNSGPAPSCSFIVTGANSGIGQGVAQAALTAGHQVVATARNMEKLRAACADAIDKLALVQLDISDQAQAKASINEAAERFGRIDVLGFLPVMCEI
ncbi:SDR family NAD(P)-dependent oxidoreductase [Pseudomonas sp. NPDC087358]|uniref:SDR family NAD(P)-dependent oxidoreductase n=1 Tax=Pseudomonas sp. NPDC087358 TaxID=3364439 RepID=UPI00384F7104